MLIKICFDSLGNQRFLGDRVPYDEILWIFVREVW